MRADVAAGIIYRAALGRQTRVIPPSTTISSPVMNDESSAARNSTARAISSVDASLPIGILASSAVWTAAASSGESVFRRERLLDDPRVGWARANNIHAHALLREL